MRRVFFLFLIFLGTVDSFSQKIDSTITELPKRDNRITTIIDSTLFDSLSLFYTQIGIANKATIKVVNSMDSKYNISTRSLIIRNYTEVIDTTFENQLRIITNNIKTYGLLYYSKNNRESEEFRYIIKNRYLKVAIGEYIIGSDFLDDCKAFEMPIEVLLHYRELTGFEASEFIIDVMQKKYINSLTKLLVPFADDLSKLLSTNISNCYVENIQLILENIEDIR